MSEIKQNNRYAFAAINPYLTTNKVEGVEKKVNNADFLLWGEDNRFTEYLFGLFTECATLQSVINGTVDFICGDEISSTIPFIVNTKGDTIEEVFEKCAFDFMIYGGFALQVIKNPFGKPAEIYWVDMSKLRSDEKNEVFYYSDDWSKSVGRVQYLVYPKWGKDDENATSIFYFKGNKTRGTYPVPVWNAAIGVCEIERKINEFHLNEISNNFLTSKIINFNNGVPDDEQKLEIERSINEKFSGSENAGRFMVSFNDNKDNGVTVENLGEDGFADRYNALSERVESQIFTAFRATPALFGLPSKSTGFNEQEYNESFKLYNRTTVKPIQKKIIDAFDKIFGIKGCVSVKPFTLENNVEKEVE